MANLVPLQFDKDSGKIILSHEGLGGEGGGGEGPGGSPSIPVGFYGVYGYVHIQEIASDTWTIEHDQNTIFYVIQAFDNAGELIIPDDISTVSADIIEIHFSASITGRAHALVFLTS